MRTIIADFNTLQIDPERVFLGDRGTPNGDRLKDVKPYERVILDGGDLMVEATLELQGKSWYAIPDWDTQHDVPAM